MSDRTVLQDLHRLTFFQGLEPDQLDIIAPSLHHKVFTSGQTLLTLGFKSEIVYFLLEGTTKVSVPQPGGGGTILNICGGGSVLGEISALDGSGHSANVTAIGECRVLWISQPLFLRYLETVPRLGLNLSRVLAQRLRHASTHARLMARKDISERLASLLLDFMRHFGPTGLEAETPLVLPLRLTQSDLGATVGATRASVNRVLTDFRQQGWIAIDEGQIITILNRTALEELGTL